MDLPRLKSHLIPRVVGRERVFLVSEGRYFLVQAPAAPEVLPYLDGTHTIVEIAQKLAGSFTLGQVVFAISRFQRFGHLADGPAGDDPGLAAAWEMLGVAPAEAAARMAAVRLRIASVGAVDQAEVVSALRAAGLGCEPVTPEAVADTVADGPGGPEQGPGPDLVVVLAEDYLHPGLAEVDARLRAAGIPWLLAKPVGAEVWTGPYLVPGETGCWQCLAQRLDENRQVENYLRRRSTDRSLLAPAVAATPWSLGQAAQLITAAVAGIVGSGGESEHRATLISTYVPTQYTDRHTLIRRPQCPGCGDPGLTARRPARIELDDAAVQFREDGGHRTMRPDATFQRMEKHIGRLLGAVISLTPLDEVDGGITYSYAARHAFAMDSDNVTLLRRNLRGQSGGKGRTDIQARVSGICEAIERYSGVWRGDRPVVRGSFDSLGSDRAVHPADLLQFSAAQYAHRDEWNAHGAGRLHVVPEPFDEAVPIDWTAAWSLTDDRERLVPSGYTWFGHPDLGTHFYCHADGNGNAAGNTLEEAILQATCEVFERDAVALWWYNRARRPGFDLDSLHEPYVDLLREHYTAAGRSLHVLDLTSDLGVPTFAAVSSRTGHPAEDVLVGFGCHLDVRIAVLRALTEVNQFLPMVVKRHPDGSTDYWEDDPHTLDWFRTVHTEEERWLLPSAAPATTTASHGTLWSGNLATDVRALADRARGAGLELLAVDQSLPDLELKAVKVMAPGLRHFWRRLGPGRLYDVPVALGWQEAPTPEEELNPRSVFF